MVGGATVNGALAARDGIEEESRRQQVQLSVMAVAPHVLQHAFLCWTLAFTTQTPTNI